MAGAALGLALVAAGCGGSSAQSGPTTGQTTGVGSGSTAPTVSAADDASAAAADDAAAPAPTIAEDAGAGTTTATTTSTADAGAAPAATPPAAADAGAPAATYSGPPPWINIRPPRVAAGITPDAARGVLRRHESAITQCYTQQLATHAHMHGTLTVRVTVIAGGTGEVNSVRLAPRSEELEHCVQSAMGGWEWPNPRGVPSAEITLTLDLAPTAPAAGHH